MSKSNLKTLSNSGRIPEILLYGSIGAASKNATNDFINQFKSLESQHKQINVRINSTGGDVFDGITIYNTIKNSKADIHVYVDGLAASMASVIALAGKKIFISRFAQLMLHKVSGNVNGDSEKLRETASLMDEVEQSISEIYATRTGLSVDEVNNKFLQRGKDTWLNAKQALQNNLVDEIFDGFVSKPTVSNDAEQLWNYYNLQIQNSLNNNEMELKVALINQLGLQESASEADIFNSLQAQTKVIAELKTENQTLTEKVADFQNQLAASQKQKIKDLIDNAVQMHRITDDQRGTYTTLAEANYEATKVALNAITPYKSIASQLINDKVDDVELKSFKDYQEKAPELLAEMKQTNPEKFTALFKKEFGKSPKLTIN